MRSREITKAQAKLPRFTMWREGRGEPPEPLTFFRDEVGRVFRVVDGLAQPSGFSPRDRYYGALHKTRAGALRAMLEEASRARRRAESDERRIARMLRAEKARAR